MAPKKAAAPPLSTVTTASTWNRLLMLTTINEDLHVVKCVCVDEQRRTDRVTLFCMSPNGTPLAEGVFKTEDGIDRCFVPFNAHDAHHKVMEVVFQEYNENDIEGVILSVRDPDQMISNANFRRARTQES